MMKAGMNSRVNPTGQNPGINRLRSILNEMGHVMVAFSGGVDSSFLLFFAVDVLGPDSVVAVTVHSPLLAEGEAEEALALAKSRGIRVKSVHLDPLADEGVARNLEDRCYICKKMIFSHLVDQALNRGVAWVLDGTNFDDDKGYRPGIRALEELGVRSPLREAGLSKGDIRTECRRMELPNWNRPSSPCLATRFPYGDPISVERLRMVDRGERFLKGLGFDIVRLRIHGNLARIEIPAARSDELLKEGTREHIVTSLKEMGFQYVTFDLEGFRSGSMDEALGFGTSDQ